MIMKMDRIMTSKKLFYHFVFYTGILASLTFSSHSWAAAAPAAGPAAAAAVAAPAVSGPYAVLIGRVKQISGIDGGFKVDLEALLRTFSNDRKPPKGAGEFVERLEGSIKSDGNHDYKLLMQALKEINKVPYLGTAGLDAVTNQFKGMAKDYLVAEFNKTEFRDPRIDDNAFAFLNNAAIDGLTPDSILAFLEILELAQKAYGSRSFKDFSALVRKMERMTGAATPAPPEEFDNIFNLPPFTGGGALVDLRTNFINNLLLNFSEYASGELVRENGNAVKERVANSEALVITQAGGVKVNILDNLFKAAGVGANGDFFEAIAGPGLVVALTSDQLAVLEDVVATLESAARKPSLEVLVEVREKITELGLADGAGNAAAAFNEGVNRLSFEHLAQKMSDELIELADKKFPGTLPGPNRGRALIHAMLAPVPAALAANRGNIFTWVASQAPATFNLTKAQAKQLNEIYDLLKRILQSESIDLNLYFILVEKLGAATPLGAAAPNILTRLRENILAFIKNDSIASKVGAFAESIQTTLNAHPLHHNLATTAAGGNGNIEQDLLNTNRPLNREQVEALSRVFDTLKTAVQKKNADDIMKVVDGDLEALLNGPGAVQLDAGLWVDVKASLRRLSDNLKAYTFGTLHLSSHEEASERLKKMCAENSVNTEFFESCMALMMAPSRNLYDEIRAPGAYTFATIEAARGIPLFTKFIQAMQDFHDSMDTQGPLNLVKGKFNKEKIEDIANRMKEASADLGDAVAPLNAWGPKAQAFANQLFLLAQTLPEGPVGSSPAGSASSGASDSGSDSDGDSEDGSSSEGDDDILASGSWKKRLKQGLCRGGSMGRELDRIINKIAEHQSRKNAKFKIKKAAVGVLKSSGTKLSSEATGIVCKGTELKVGQTWGRDNLRKLSSKIKDSKVISREHFVIAKKGGSYGIVSMGYNGTKMNGKRLESNKFHKLPSSGFTLSLSKGSATIKCEAGDGDGADGSSDGGSDDSDDSDDDKDDDSDGSGDGDSDSESDAG